MSGAPHWEIWVVWHNGQGVLDGLFRGQILSLGSISILGRMRVLVDALMQFQQGCGCCEGRAFYQANAMFCGDAAAETL